MFIAVKIVPNIRSRGITPGPKLTASTIIHNKIASVKIVQNTNTPPERVVVSRSCSSVCGYVPLRDRSVMGSDSARFFVGENLPLFLIQI
jgi:hypothetical protein